jgi:hypothetical protein
MKSEEKPERRIVGKCAHYLHNGWEIDESTFEYKGCWGCYHFHRNDILMTVSEVAEAFGVSASTIYRWLRKDKKDKLKGLRGRVYKRVRKSSWESGRNTVYFFERDSLPKEGEC